jgi:hypothetical protein
MEISLLRLERIQKDSTKFLSHHIRILKKLFFEIKNLNLEDTERSNHPHWFDKITITNFLLLNFLGLDFLRDLDEDQLKEWQEVYIKHSNPIKLVIHIMKHYPAIPVSQKMIDYYHKNEETLSRNLGKINWIYYSQLLNSGYIWIRNYHTSDSFPPNSITFDIFDKLSFLHDEENATKETTQQGVVYTPYNIASQIVKRSIDRIIEKRDFSLEFQNNLSKIRILDPSVGTGVFLIAAGNIITEELSKNCKKENLTKLRKNIVTNNLFGLDIDPLGINITKIKLFLWISERDSNIDQEIIGFKNIRVGDTLFGFSPTSKLPYDSNKSDLTENFEDIFLKHLGVFQIHRKKTLHEKIQHINKIKNDIVKLEGFRYFILEGRQEEWNLHNSGLNPAIRKRVHFSKTDSYRNTENYYAIFKQDTLELRQNLPSYIKPYHFKSAFHWVDMQFSIKFDLIIGNPPFIALTDLSMLSRLKLNNFYPEIYNGNSDLASFFIYRMREFISNNGILGFILPKYVMTSVHSTKIREAILNDFGILEIHDFDKSTIFRAYSVKTVFFLLRRRN